MGFLVALLAALALAITAAHAEGDEAPLAFKAGGSAGSRVPCSLTEQLGLGINAALPLPDVAGSTCKLDSAAPVGQAIMAAMWVAQLASWGFATLFVAGFTGLARRP